MTSVAVVTGAARNLGREIVLGLARQGLDVVVNTRSSGSEALGVAQEAQRLGVRALPFEADVTDEQAVAEMFSAAASLGSVRVLVNNAVLRKDASFDTMTFADWRGVQAVTLDGAFICARAAVPLLLEGGGGCIVNMLGGNALAGDARRAHLSAAKHGLVGLTLALASAYARQGITVNAVSPVGMKTDSREALQERRRAVADVVCFLASPQARAVTGQVVDVDCAQIG
ncbi:MAG: SDR family NAD(P)-dependent oxidoreductase [Nocardioidaceae bacterium]